MFWVITNVYCENNKLREMTGNLNPYGNRMHRLLQKMILQF